jgi:hypothetical protein
VVTRKGSNSARKISNSNDKVMFTALVCCSANGEFLPPHVVYKGQRGVRSNWTLGFDNCTYGVTPSGWMEGPQFTEWFKTSFVPFVSKYSGEKILYLDGHHSHISIPLFDIADEHNVFLLKLIAHSSHLQQPLDNINR